MIKYTRTTEEVREAIVKHFMPSNRYNTMSAVEFDRWLKQVKATVWDEAITAQLETQSAVRGITIQIAPNPYREERQ